MGQGHGKGTRPSSQPPGKQRWLGRQNQGSPGAGQSPMNTRSPSGAGWLRFHHHDRVRLEGGVWPSHLDNDDLARLELCPAPFLIHHHELSSIGLKQGFSSAVILVSPSVPLSVLLSYHVVLCCAAPCMWVCFGDWGWEPCSQSRRPPGCTQQWKNASDIHFKTTVIFIAFQSKMKLGVEEWWDAFHSP